MAYLLLLIGFVLLIKGADVAVEGGTGIANHFRVSPVIIGLTVIAFGTSLPEMAVSVTGSLTGQNGIAVGNVVGSNLFNLLVVGGLSAVVSPVVVNRDLLRRDIPFSLLAAVFIVIFAAPAFIGGGDSFTIGRLGGGLLLAVFAVFMVLLFRSALKDRRQEEEEAVAAKRPLWLDLVFTVAGLVAIIVGSDLVVDSAKTIAYSFGFSETLVGLTIVSVGTSLPELVTSLIASKKGSNDIALGNIIGSNIFNLLLVLGVAAAISPVTVPSYLFIDAVLLAAVTVMALFFGKNRSLNRLEGIILFVIYLVYFVYIFFRG